MSEQEQSQAPEAQEQPQAQSQSQEVSNAQIFELLQSLTKRVDALETAPPITPTSSHSPSSHEPDLSELIGAIDQGTTSSRFLIFNKTGDPVASHQVEFTQYYPQPGQHEHDPLELVSSVRTCIDQAVKQLEEIGGDRKYIKAVGITNQRETTVLWDKRTGEPLYNAIVWTDTRSAALIRDLKARNGSDKLQSLCGLPLSTYPSIAKILWMLENVAKVRAAYQEGNLAFGTIDSWLVYKLNGGAEEGTNIHVSDPTNASRSMLMNIETLDYDQSLLDFFKLDRAKLTLPTIVKSSHKDAYGQITSGALAGVPITGCLGDQSAALVGQKGFEPGRAKNTYGTGCFLLYNVGEKPVISTHGLLTTISYDFEGYAPMYALEGSIAVAGSAIKFLRDNLALIENSEDINDLAETVDDNGGIIFVTAFSGLFAPYWIDDVKGTILGITNHTKKGHIARATLEAACFQTKAILDSMEKDSGKALQRLAVDGGMSNSDLCMQTQSDLIGIPVDRPKMRETTALGAAIAAGLAVGTWKDLDAVKGIDVEGGTVFEPKVKKEDASKSFARWEKAVYTCSGFV